MCCISPPFLENNWFSAFSIRTQPKDLLLWSVSYFRSLADGDVPPVKERLEYPVPPSESGLTPGLLRVLHKQVMMASMNKLNIYGSGGKIYNVICHVNGYNQLYVQ